MGIIIGIILFIAFFVSSYYIGGADKRDIVFSICSGIFFWMAAITLIVILVIFVMLGLVISEYF